MTPKPIFILIMSVSAFLMGPRIVLAQSTTRSTPVDESTVQQKIDRLASALDRAQQQVDELRGELNALREEQRAQARAESVTTMTAVPAAASDSTSATEEQEMQAAEIRQQQQVKVESTSKFPLRVTGLVLFNAIRNFGVVDEVDLPVSALIRSAGTSHGSLAATMRQTLIGLAGTGPVLGGAHTSARVDMDFFGGVTGGVTSAPAGIVRFRTASIGADWEHNSLEARVDSPLISPLSPTSIATVAEPALAWSGNLWTWAPEVRYTHRFNLRTKYNLVLESGLRDAYLANAQVDQVVRAVSPAELSELPTFEGRIAFVDRTAQDHGAYGTDDATGLDLGVGGSFGQQNYGKGVLVNTWSLTGDWRFPLGRWLSISGEAYTGTGLGSLGGGAYRDVVQGTNPTTGVASTVGLDASGGWAQLSAVAGPRLQFHAAFGQDSGSGSELRSLTMAAPSNPVAFYARSRTIFGNLIYRPWQSFTISPEYRFLQSWPINGTFNVTHVFTISAGYQF